MKKDQRPTRKASGRRPSKPFQLIKDGVVFELQPEPEGGYTIMVPSLPGCVSYGQTFEEAVEMIKDAMRGWLDVAEEEGVPIPDHFKKMKIAAI